MMYEIYGFKYHVIVQDIISSCMRLMDQ